MSKAEVLIIKIGEVAQLTFADGSQYESRFVSSRSRR